MKKIFFLALLSILLSKVCAQKSLFIEPLIGIQNTFSRLDKSIPTLSPYSFRNYNRWNVIGSLGIFLRVKINSKYSVNGGILDDGIGWGYKITNVNYGIGHESFRAPYMYRMPFLLHYSFGERHWRELDAERQIYLAIFRFTAIGGVSYDRLADDINNVADSSSFFSQTSGKHDGHVNISRQIRNWGVGLWVGAGIQFLHKGKEKLYLQLIYKQGLLDILNIDVYHTIDDQTYYNRLKTRGSALSLNLSFPIRLVRFQKKKYNYFQY